MSINSSYSSYTAPGFQFGICQISVLNRAVFTAFFISYSLFLPLFIFVLWQLSHRRSSAVETREADVFTFYIVLLQSVGVVAISVFCYGTFCDSEVALLMGFHIYSSIAPGETMFHVLTCVERYLAVVHPITYRGLRQSDGVRIRNISIGCVWLLCLIIIGVCYNELARIILTFLMLVSALAAVTFCSISVLFVMIRPGPGEVGGVSERVNRAKQKAFYTILVIMTTLIIRFLSYLVYAFLSIVLRIKTDDPCLFFWSVNWFSLPSVLVLPLLFLQRVGKLPRCGHSSTGLIRKLQHILCC